MKSNKVIIIGNTKTQSAAIEALLNKSRKERKNVLFVDVNDKDTLKELGVDDNLVRGSPVSIDFQEHKK